MLICQIRPVQLIPICEAGVSLGMLVDGCKILIELSEISINGCKLPLISVFNKNRWVLLHQLTHPNDAPVRQQQQKNIISTSL